MRPTSNDLQTCDYCGLTFGGHGYSPDGKRHFCCYGCCLVQKIVGDRGWGGDSEIATQDGTATHHDGIAAWILLRLGIGAFLSMNVMMISLVLYTDSALGSTTVHGLRWALAFLSTPAMAIMGGSYILGSLRDLKRRRLSTDALITTGSLAAYGVSAANVIRGSGHIYFDTATMLLVIVTLGRLLEASAKGRASRAIRDMVELMPGNARVLRDGQEEEIPSGEVRVSDLMLVKPGECIPADGVIIEGSCMVEESPFTGEARPRYCDAGAEVFGGSVNCDGLITVEATATGSDSLTGRIQQMVRQAQHDRAPIERLAEKAASVFVPVVWAAAVGAAAYWGIARHDHERAGLSALAVLVVACPCSLGLATPMATALAIAKAARAGILVRSGEVLERLPAIREVFFDKTGTLTTSELSVSEIHTADGCDSDEALALAARLESGSRHAIARAIVAAARERGLLAGQVTDFRVSPGLGVEGMVESRRVMAGSLRLFSERFNVPEELFRIALDHNDLTTIYVGWDGAARAAMSLKDSLRADAFCTIQKLAAVGIRSAVISGDGESPTRRIARELGISKAFSECSPEEKAAVVQKARAASRSAVAMVGDGINDAAALAEASVGIAVGSGTDLARQSGDIILIGDNLTRIPWLLELSTTTCRIIRQNLWWAFGYNSVAISLAFMGYIHPLIAASAMFASSLSVIANSMRILSCVSTKALISPTSWLSLPNKGNI